MSLKFLLHHCRHGFGFLAGYSPGNGRESVQSDVFLAPAFCFLCRLCFTACVMIACVLPALLRETQAVLYVWVFARPYGSTG